VFNNNYDTTNSVAGTQGLISYAIYGYRSTFAALNDLFTLSGLENVGNPTAAGDATIDDTTKYLFQSGIMDITVRNTSDLQTAAGVFNQVGEAKLELDVYEISVKKNARDATGNFNSLLSILRDGEYAQTINAGTALTLTQRGTTPWDLPASLSKFGVKIWKKTKFFIPNNDTITYQIRDPKRHVLTRRELTQAEGCNYPGMTRFILMIFKLVPGLTIGPNVNEYRARINVGTTRKYMYKIEGFNQSRDSYIVA